MYPHHGISRIIDFLKNGPRLGISFNMRKNDHIMFATDPVT
jgi:hypothetical protein